MSCQPKDLVRQVICNRLSSINTEGLNWQAIVDAAAGLSQAELVLAAEQAAKQVILSNSTHLSTDLLTASLLERQLSKGESYLADTLTYSPS